MGLNCYSPHAKYFGDYYIGYLPLKTRTILQELEVSILCCLELGEVCQILTRVRRQGHVRGLYKWLEDKDIMVDDVIEKENIYYLMFRWRKCLGMGWVCSFYVPVLLKYPQFDYEFTRETLGLTTGPFS